jgi:tripartite-type tricarboxylate transporter receptor subunit TctC
MSCNRARRRLVLGLACAGSGAWTPLARAQGAADYPSRPVTIIVPNVAGGAIDILARVLQQQLQLLWSQPVLVEYKPGAGTVVGTDYVAKARPDGHTLCLVATPHVINPALRQLPYDTQKDLAGITVLGVSNVLISANPNFPANTLKEAIALIRKNPGKFSYASPGSGSSMHLAMELLKQRAGLDILHVPFKGSGPAYPEVMAGRIELLVDPLFSCLSFVRAGKLNALALTGDKRSALAPEIETVAETVPGFNVLSMFALVVAAGTPREVVHKIYGDVRIALQKPETIRKMADLGMEPVSVTPEQFDAQIKSDIERWTALVKSAHITAE